MIRICLAGLLILVSSATWAAIYDAVITGATKVGSQWAIKSPTATVSAGAVQTVAKVPVGSTFTANVSGGGVSIAGGVASVPVAMQVASTAGQVAMTAIRLNPAGLVVGLTAQWLLGQGLQYANNNWTKQTTEQNYNWGGQPSVAALVNAVCASRGAPTNLDINTIGVVAYSAGAVAQAESIGLSVGIQCNHSWVDYWWKTCTATGAQFWQGCAPGQTVSVPAQEADFTQAASAPLSDGAAGELVKVIDLPVEPPTYPSSAPVDVDSAPYLDPISGRMVKDTARLTPSPTADNPLGMRIERYQRDAGDVSGQTTAAPAPTKEASIANQPLNVQFPSDYARQGEAQSAATSITDALGAKIDKITETGADPADPLQPATSEFDQAFFQGTFTNLLGWQLPGHSSQCPTSGFTWNGEAYVIDSHCQLVQDHFSALSTVMAVVWTVLALFILLGA